MVALGVAQHKPAWEVRFRSASPFSPPFGETSSKGAQRHGYVSCSFTVRE